MSDISLLIVGILLNSIGITGCVIPGIPGPPLSYLSLILIQWRYQYFDYSTLIILAIITILVVVADYIIPLWTGKKFGATKQGIRGSLIGMFIGIFLTPIGMIAGLISGSIIGDLMANRNIYQAGKAGIGILLGTLVTIGIKLLVCGYILFCFIRFYLWIL